MIVYSVVFLEGTSTKTGKPYAGYSIEGVSLFNDQLRNDRAFVSSAAFGRNPVNPGDVIEVFRSGEIYIKGKNIFDINELKVILES